MEFLIISGMSGAGKSLTADILEDMDYYCVDNMPVALLPRFAELCRAAGGKYERVALVTDVREGESLSQLFATLDGLWSTGLEYRILFVEADVQTLVRRYKSSRRRHPLMSPGDSIEDAIARETAVLEPVRERADYIINTTGLTTAALQSRIAGLLSLSRERRLAVTVTAFGYKYGLPLDADLVLDVRFLPNPYYVEELRPLSGLDAPVYGFVLGSEGAQRFMELLEPLLGFLLPRYTEEGKYTLNIAVGCTGGRHRSVAVARAVADALTRGGADVALSCRDLEKGG